MPSVTVEIAVLTAERKAKLIDKASHSIGGIPSVLSASICNSLYRVSRALEANCFSMVIVTVLKLVWVNPGHRLTMLIEVDVLNSLCLC